MRCRAPPNGWVAAELHDATSRLRFNERSSGLILQGSSYRPPEPYKAAEYSRAPQGLKGLKAESTGLPMISDATAACKVEKSPQPRFLCESPNGTVYASVDMLARWYSTRPAKEFASTALGAKPKDARCIAEIPMSPVIDMKEYIATPST